MNQERKWLDLNINEIEPKPLSTERKSAIKTHVLSRSKVRKRFSVHYVAVAVLGVSVVTASFLTPAIANQFPIIQSILSYFEDEALPDTYVDLSTVVNEVQTSNGIDVMIESAVYDGTNVIVTYAIQTEEELGENPRSNGYLQVEQANGIGGSGSIKKVNETTYVGIEKVTPHFKGDSPEEILIQWQPRSFINTHTDKQFDGSWSFEFTLAQLSTDVQLLNQTMEQNGIKLVIKSLEHSEMAAVLEYEFYVDQSILQAWKFVSVEMMEVKDNLGNVYEVDGNGGISYDDGAMSESRATIYSLDPNATSLTLTPQVYYSKESGGALEIVKMAPMTIHLD
ncbi:DUF4179 domain-containing protein [Ornithinibacillus scapharcae]|uniref:DUF4179 domain-containing protein n=1 Tax=Ornithinibacillus scapharcae TaxID=1147159 RepID=UPI000225BA55|nr:DUF4179 domain-containing protein [Ornithinibacillus scapharcae]